MMEGEENGPLFDGVVLTIIPSEDLNVRYRHEVGTHRESVFGLTDTDLGCSLKKPSRPTAVNIYLSAMATSRSRNWMS